jgi:hypothetical protein
MPSRWSETYEDVTPAPSDEDAPHYDLTAPRREAALKAGAVFVPGRQQAAERIAARRKDSPGMPPGQTAEASEEPTVVRVEEESPGPGCGVNEAPARVEHPLERGAIELAHMLIEAARGNPDDFTVTLVPAVPPSTWLPPGASEPEPACGSTGPCDPGCRPCDARDVEERSGDPSFTDAQVESALRKAWKPAAEVDDERAARVHAKVFGSEHGRDDCQCSICCPTVKKGGRP